MHGHGPNEDDPMCDEHNPQVIGPNTGNAFQRPYEVEVNRRMRQSNTVTVWASNAALAMETAEKHLGEICPDSWVDDNEFYPKVEVANAQESV